MRSFRLPVPARQHQHHDNTFGRCRGVVLRATSFRVGRFHQFWVMTQASTKSGLVWPVVLARFEQHAPVSVMARTTLEHALSPDWIDAVFEAERQRQYSRELLFSTVVELMTLVVTITAAFSAPVGRSSLIRWFSFTATLN
jgi:hypothetical protein